MLGICGGLDVYIRVQFCACSKCTYLFGFICYLFI